jgi:transposase-like protein
MSTELTIFDFQARFSTEEACYQHLYAARWPDGFVCPSCGGTRPSLIMTRGIIQCLDCTRQTSLTAGTIMHRTKMPLRVWFWGAYLVATSGPGIAATQFQRQMGLSRYETAFQMLHKLRAGLVQGDDAKLLGAVEVDETFIGGPQPGPRGRGALGKSVVVGAVEVASGRKRPYSGRVKLRAIPNASGRNLMTFLADRVAAGSTVVTDEWRGYRRASEQGYRHVLAEGRDGLVHIHRAFSNLKTWIRGTHRFVSRKHLQAYLNEYSFRFNGRRRPAVTFESLLGIAMNRAAPTYRQLYDAGSRRKHGWRHPNVPVNL